MNKKITLLLCVFYWLIVQPVHAQTPQLWGTTFNGGEFLYGAAFNINGAGGGYDMFKSFNLYAENPSGDFVQFSDNNLYITCKNGGGTTPFGSIFSINPTTNVATDVYDFPYNCTFPVGSLVAANGLLYGYTLSGGTDGDGAIFSFSPVTKTFTVVHNFNDTTGGVPQFGGLSFINNMLYGVTPVGGANNLGVLFSLNPTDNTYKDLFDFDDTYGSAPYGKLIAVNSVLYGTASAGGKYSAGVIYSFDPSTSSYNDVVDLKSNQGSGPDGGLVYHDGVFYGMTTIGGEYNYGAIYTYTPSTLTYADVHDFDNAHGQYPMGSLYLASDSNLYGLTRWGGTNGDGTVFKFKEDSGIFDLLYSFGNTSTDAANPFAGLVEANNSTTGISTVTETHFSIYPNPTAGEVSITSSANMDELKVTNLLGQTIYQSFPNQNKVTIDIKDDGIYFVTVTSGGESITRQLIVIK